jgi:hypothetical protein
MMKLLKRLVLPVTYSAAAGALTTGGILLQWEPWRLTHGGKDDPFALTLFVGGFVFVLSLILWMLLSLMCRPTGR